MPALILLVDDDPMVQEVLGEFLGEQYALRRAATGREALEMAHLQPVPDMVLLDVELPDMQGYAVCAALKMDESVRQIPVIFLSSHTLVDDITRGLELGAVDYVTKPVALPILAARVKTHLRLRETHELLLRQNAHLDSLVALRTRDLEARTAELARSQELTIVALGSIAETRDNETGNHIHRTRAYVETLCRSLACRPSYRDRLSEEAWAQIWKSAPLHDIGKVGIPDAILLKPGALSSEEFAVMKTHATLGRDAIRAAERRIGLENSFLSVAGDIAYSHHERWNGSGYPQGLREGEIPLAARIMAVADVYDALSSRRVYKAAKSHEESCEIILGESGAHFDPEIVACFVREAEQFARIARAFSDEKPGASPDLMKMLLPTGLVRP